MKVKTSPKHNYKKEIFFGAMIVFIIAALSVSSWLLWENFQNKTWEEIKTIIVASIATYGGLTWLAIKVTMDIIIYTKRFKTQIETKIELIEQPSKYLPKETKKVSQNALKQEFEDYCIEKKIGDNLVRITPKEIVIVFGKDFVDRYEFKKSMSSTWGAVMDHITQINSKSELKN